VEVHRDERSELAAVKSRLSARYAHLPEAAVASVVDEIYRDLDGPVRDFVPVLVEHLARDRLALGPGPARTDA
jgi:hypothetical protein